MTEFQIEIEKRLIELEKRFDTHITAKREVLRRIERLERVAAKVADLIDEV